MSTRVYPDETFLLVQSASMADKTYHEDEWEQWSLFGGNPSHGPCPGNNTAWNVY